MQKLEQLQRKVKSAEELQSITRTMKILSAVSIHQFEEAVRSLSEYFGTLELGMQIVLRSAYSNLIPVEKKDRVSAVGIIASGSGQSLCGPFDEVMSDYIRENVENSDSENLHVLVLGERLADHLVKDGFTIQKVLEVPGSVEGISSVVLSLLKEIEHWQSELKIESIQLIHNKPLARKGFTPRVQHLLPMNKAWLDRLISRPWSTNNLPQFTMDADVLFMSLLRQYLFVSLFRALAESLAAEYGSRLSSMQRAEKKIEERLGLLRNKFLHERQASITEELLDIMAGFEAVSHLKR
ncbi:MAG: F0F1 ATP synthase subunit gamma [Gracilimonas sp.]|uniref:F0F1 ATP synthase subunit gamma n=1 Tax=Gracilimonas sp. TaxID=1974203 RepID=UPI0019CAFF3D|nr:F0F1 ATP synthase subunit gamma [Gracilimonas sp.]MBD3616304.1 F0F1 ATP synthase subunit gamma [Gracilimonas sp.]